MGHLCDKTCTPSFTSAEEEFVFGREKSLNELTRRFDGRCSFVLNGPSGAGKTFLLRRATRNLKHVLYCSDSSTGQSVFASLALELLRVKNRKARQSLRDENTVRNKSTIALRGFVFDALSHGVYWIVLDHLRAPAAGLSSDVRDIMLCVGTPVALVARSTHMEDLGFLAPMFVLRDDQMKLPNFRPSETAQFAREIAQRIRLNAVNRLDFLNQIVEYSRGAPGAVVTMLQMAARPKYRAGEYIKTSPLYIDFLLSWHQANAF